MSIFLPLQTKEIRKVAVPIDSESLFLRETRTVRGVSRHEDITWEKHPVLYVDLNVENYKKPEVLTDKLNLFLCNWEKIYGKDENEVSLGSRFEGVIRRAYEQTGLKAVILVDEYDKPLLEAIGKCMMGIILKKTP